ncbi:MAG: hypothetical protein OER87_08190, partial [Gammaproteobacteria bacterium]|nr:hypothetical protein [Gammaproteobacteria bacterium]
SLPLSAVIVLWVTEVIPLYVAALTASFLLLQPGDFSATDIFHPYFDDAVLFLLPVVFLLPGMVGPAGFACALRVNRRPGDCESCPNIRWQLF